MQTFYKAVIAFKIPLVEVFMTIKKIMLRSYPIFLKITEFSFPNPVHGIQPCRCDSSH